MCPGCTMCLSFCQPTSFDVLVYGNYAKLQRIDVSITLHVLNVPSTNLCTWMSCQFRAWQQGQITIITILSHRTNWSEAEESNSIMLIAAVSHTDSNVVCSNRVTVRPSTHFTAQSNFPPKEKFIEFKI